MTHVMRENPDMPLVESCETLIYQTSDTLKADSITIASIKICLYRSSPSMITFCKKQTNFQSPTELQSWFPPGKVSPIKYFYPTPLANISPRGETLEVTVTSQSVADSWATHDFHHHHNQRHHLLLFSCSKSLLSCSPPFYNDPPFSLSPALVTTATPVVLYLKHQHHHHHHQHQHQHPVLRLGLDSKQHNIHLTCATLGDLVACVFNVSSATEHVNELWNGKRKWPMATYCIWCRSWWLLI